MTPQPAQNQKMFARLDANISSRSNRGAARRDNRTLYWQIPQYKAAELSFARVDALREDRMYALVDKVEREVELHPEKLVGTDINLFKGRLRLLTALLSQIKNTYTSLSLTNEDSLYGRVHLTAGKGTIHIELLLGDEESEGPDTFITLYEGNKQIWSIADEFRQAMTSLRCHMGIGSAC